MMFDQQFNNHKIFKRLAKSLIRLCVRAGLSETLLVAHITLFEISCCGSHSIKYEGCSNMNASSFITFFTYMLQQNCKRFYKGLYVTFKLAPDPKENTVYLSSYSPLNEGHVSILTNSVLRTYTSDKDKRIILP